MLDWRELVPVLTDGVVTLRAPYADDYPAIVEWAADPDTVRFTTIPQPPDGYGAADAEIFVEGLVAEGWRTGRTLTWLVEADVDGRLRACGTIDLRADVDPRPDTTLLPADPDAQHQASVGYVTHPAARGRGVTARALRLLVAHAFDELALSVIRWQAAVGNDASWHVAAAAGFTYEGVRRRVAELGGEWVDMWQASIVTGDPRSRNEHPVALGYPQEPPSDRR